MISVEVAYAKPDEQVLLPVELETGSTVTHDIFASGILQRFPEIDLRKNKVGVFSRACNLSRELKTGDRVEIYRALIHDPMEARRLRAKRGGGSQKNKVS